MYEFILKNFAMHVQLDEAEKELITAKLQQATIKKNGVLLRAGEVCRNIYFVDSGCLRVFNRDQQGEEHRDTAGRFQSRNHDGGPSAAF